MPSSARSTSCSNSQRLSLTIGLFLKTNLSPQLLENVQIFLVRAVALNPGHLQQEGHVPERWMTHDDLEALKAHFAVANVLVAVDARPSDAIALALRVRAPIFAEDTVIDNAKQLDVSSAKGDSERLQKWLEALDPDVGAAALTAGSLELAGHAIAPADVELVRVERQGFAAATLDSGVSLVLDMVIDDALLSKGLAREITRRVQAQRKALDLAIEDRIALEVWLPDGALELADDDWGWVQSETRAVDAKLHHKAAPKRAEHFEVDGVALGFTARHA